MAIDAHQHFWTYRPRDYSWIDDHMGVLKRDFGPLDLAPHLATAGLDGSVAVQASASERETRELLALSDAHPAIRGVVGWVDLVSPDVERALERFAAHPRACGVRHGVQDEPDDRFLLREDFLRGVRSLAAFDLAYDLLIVPKQLPAAIEFARRLPDQRMVVDHLAKPRVASGVIEPWASQIRELARSPNVYCKVSGMVTEASWTSWQATDLRPYLDVVFEAFGVERLMFGSDWPVCLLAASYERVVSLVRDYVAGFDSGDREKLFGGNAAGFYKLAETR